MNDNDNDKGSADASASKEAPELARAVSAKASGVGSNSAKVWHASS